MKYENLSKEQQLSMVNQRLSQVEQQHYDTMLTGEGTMRTLQGENRDNFERNHKAVLKGLEEQHRFLKEQKAELEK